MNQPEVALIVGAGPGLSASLARRFAAAGYRPALAARNVEKLAALAAETGARTFACDATEEADVGRLFAEVAAAMGTPAVVVYNASGWRRGAIAELEPADVANTLAVTAFGGFLVGREAARAMAARGSGTILFTGATASIKGSASFAAFAMGKFALRGLAQSMARELGPKGIHVAHVIVDGGIRGERHVEPADAPDSLLDPDAIAEVYLGLVAQPRSAWTQEIDLRPAGETF